MMKIITEWREYSREYFASRIRVSVGFDAEFAVKHKQPAYFSITVELSDGSGGCMHEVVKKFFPELAHLVRWHLVDETGTPLHYIANARYWAQVASGELKNSEYGPDPMEAFKSTVVWGAVDSDETIGINRAIADPVAFCEERRAKLATAFFHDVEPYLLQTAVAQ